MDSKPLILCAPSVLGMIRCNRYRGDFVPLTVTAASRIASRQNSLSFLAPGLFAPQGDKRVFVRNVLGSCPHLQKTPLKCQRKCCESLVWKSNLCHDWFSALCFDNRREHHLRAQSLSAFVFHCLQHAQNLYCRWMWRVRRGGTSPRRVLCLTQPSTSGRCCGSRTSRLSPCWRESRWVLPWRCPERW